MLNPSYSQLMNILNKEAEIDQKVTSRYSVVIAAAKRARQIVGGADYEDMGLDTDKAVSIAVNEIYKGHVRVVPKDGMKTWFDDTEVVVQNMPTLIDDSYVMADDTAVDFDDIDDSGDDDPEGNDDGWDDDGDGDDEDEDAGDS